MLLFGAMGCNTLAPIIGLVKLVINIIQIGIPIILIVLGMLDLGKAVVASKEDEIKSAQKLLIKRVIYAVLVFFVIFIVKTIFSAISDNSAVTGTGSDSMSWWRCWNDAGTNTVTCPGTQHYDAETNKCVD